MPTEFELIQAFLSVFERAKVPVGPGDDAAVLAPTKLETCVTTDAVVEGVHFTRKRFSLEDIGHKALAVNLSDLAAMGARPTWFVCAIAAPRLSLAEVTALGRGMRGAGELALVGGNFTRAPVLSLTLTVAGEVPRGRALLRSGAKRGDLLYVSGTLGDARLGLEGNARRSRQQRPTARVTLGLLARDFASAAIDVSDGLVQDAGHLADASGVGVTLHASRLPKSAAMKRHLARHPQDAWFPSAGGEDYELLLAVPCGRAKAFERACRNARERVTCIGECVHGAGVQLLDDRGRPVRIRRRATITLPRAARTWFRLRGGVH